LQHIFQVKAGLAPVRLDDNWILRLKKQRLVPKSLLFRFERVSTLRLPQVVLAVQT
jgi:hypothetical protein